VGIEWWKMGNGTKGKCELAKRKWGVEEMGVGK